MAVKWKWKPAAGGSVSPELQNKVNQLEQTTASHTTSINGLETKYNQQQTAINNLQSTNWTRIYHATSGNITNQEITNLQSMPNLVDNKTYMISINLATAADKDQVFTWCFKKRNINWTCSPVFEFYNDLDFTTSKGKFKFVLGTSSQTVNKAKIAQPSNQNIPVGSGFEIWIREVR